MIQLHKIRIQQRFADAKLDCDKLFEVRQNDRYYQKGDLLQYTVITNSDSNVPNMPIVTHPLNNCTYEITYVYSGPGVEQGYVVLGEQDVTVDYTNKTGKFENLQQLNPTENNNNER
jgi:uncharacterized protein (UPF0210 family)